MSTYRAVFNWISKVIRVCFGFALLRSVIGWQNSRHFFSQWEAKPKPIAHKLHARIFPRLASVACNYLYDWFTGLLSSFVIGQSTFQDFHLHKPNIINLSSQLRWKKKGGWLGPGIYSAEFLNIAGFSPHVLYNFVPSDLQEMYVKTYFLPSEWL